MSTPIARVQTAMLPATISSVVMQRESDEDQRSKAARADVAAKRRERNHRDRGDANAADNHRQCLGKFDSRDALHGGHSHPQRRIALRGIDAAHAGDDVAHQHELCVDDQRHEDRRRPKSDHFNQQREQREARDRVDRAEYARDRCAERARCARSTSPAAAQSRARSPVRPATSARWARASSVTLPACASR